MLGKWFISNELKCTYLAVYELRSDFMASMKSVFVWETAMNTQRRCDRMSKITENWLNIAAFGYMDHYNISNVAPTEPRKMSERNIFLLQPIERQLICKLT